MRFKLLFLALSLLPTYASAQQEIVLPLHHGCGELVYTRQEGWALRPDTTGTLHFPRTYVFEGEMGQGLRTVAEYDADSVLVRTWRLSPLTDGVCVEQAPYGRALYTFDSLGTLVSVRYQSMEGSPRPGPGMPFPSPEKAGATLVPVFDAGGRRIGLADGIPGTLLVQRGFGAPADTVFFADPVHDPADLADSTALEFITEGDVRYSLRKVGVYDRAHHGLIRGMLFLKCRSAYYGPLDFARTGEHPIRRGTFYVARTAREGALAHSNYNFGNFLWGAAAQAVGVPLWISLLGSHINNMMHTHGQPDSKDDQLSISAGYHFSKDMK